MVDEEAICNDSEETSIALISSQVTNEGMTLQDVRRPDAIRQIISPPLWPNTVKNRRYRDEALLFKNVSFYRDN